MEFCWPGAALRLIAVPYYSYCVISAGARTVQVMVPLPGDDFGNGGPCSASSAYRRSAGASVPHDSYGNNSEVGSITLLCSWIQILMQ